MAGNGKQKQKILELWRLLRDHTDEDHPMPMPQILRELENAGICAERKGIYDDLNVLRDFGEDVEVSRDGGRTGYYLGDRGLELAERKLLVDAVQASRFITEKKSRQLIEKLSIGISEYQSREMNRQVYVTGRVKSMNEAILYNVDALHCAIREERQIRFRYFDWTVRKTREYHRGGAAYQMSPLGLVWQDENYYLVAGESGREVPRHFRVDKMEDITVLDEPRVRDCGEIDPARYAATTFGMFAGEPVAVELSVEDRLAGVIIDRFGREPVFRPTAEGRFYVTVKVIPSPIFYGWALSFGGGVRIVSPSGVREACRKQALEALGEL